MSRKESRNVEDIGLFALRPEQIAEALQKVMSKASAEERTGAPDEYRAIIESICGATDDSQPVEQYDGTLGVTTDFVAANQEAVCQVQWKSDLGSVYSDPGNVSDLRWGTGTMITANLMITCGHLFDQNPHGWKVPRINGTSSPIPSEEIAQSMRVNFNYQVDPDGNLRTETSFDVLELVEYRLGGLDMAICRIDGNPGNTFGTATVSTTDASVSDMICIIGHPAGRPKRVEAGPTTDVTGNLIRYNDIDTLGGNSGSGVLRAQDGRIVGIHTNGGCSSHSPGPGGGSNYGLRIERFIEESPTLQELTRPKSPILDIKNTYKDDLLDKVKNYHDSGWKKPHEDFKYKIRDDVKSKAMDDVKNPYIDKHPASDTKGFDIPPGIGGVGRRPTQPFVLATPHHAEAFQRSTPPQAAGPSPRELEVALDQVLTQLQQLDAQYQDLLAQYQSVVQRG